MTPEIVSLLFALALGVLIGAGIGVRSGLRLAERRRATSSAHAQLARLWPGQLPQRSAADILAGVIRVSLGGLTYTLPVLSRKAAREWLESLDRRFAALAVDLEKAGNDTPTILTRLISEASGLLDMLYQYDVAAGGILPPRTDLEDNATDTEILRAVLEVWRAVNPLADTLVEMGEQEAVPPTDGTRLAQLTTPPRPTGGDPTTSTTSPTSSSSPTSMPRRTASSETRARSSNGSSKRSASARASSTTSGRTRAGGHASGRRPRSRPGTAGA
jgi:hypothetical protein